MYGSTARAVLGGSTLPEIPVTTGLTLWLDAADHLTITQSSNLVSSWADKSGNDYVFTASGTARPTTNTRTIGGVNVLDFDGTTDVLTGNAIFSDIATASAMTAFVVVNVDSSSSTRNIFGCGSSHFQLYSLSTEKLRYFNYDGTNDNLDVSITFGTSYIVMIRHESGNLYISLNGGSETSVASGNTANTSNNAEIGGSGSGGLNGVIGEIAVYNTALSSGNITTVIDYLSTKWGIS